MTRNGGLTWSFVQMPLLPGENEGDVVHDFGPPLFSSAVDGYFPVEAFSTREPNRPALIGTYSTHDDGQTWSGNAPLIEREPVSFYAHDFLPDGHGWVGVGNQLAITEDGGASWSLRTPVGLPARSDGKNLIGLTFVDPTTGWALVDALSPASTVDLYMSSDGGRTWARIAT